MRSLALVSADPAPKTARAKPANSNTSAKGPPKKRGVAKKAAAGTFEVLGRWAKDLGLSWFDVMQALSVPRNSAWRTAKGTAGVEWAVAIETFLIGRAKAMGKKSNPAAMLREWTEIGLRLAKDQPEAFDGVLASVHSSLRLLPPPKEEPFVFMVRERRVRSPRK